MADIYLAHLNGDFPVPVVRWAYNGTSLSIAEKGLATFASQEMFYESMVSFVSRRYKRVVNESLMVCLSEYLPLRGVYSCDKSLNRHA